MTPTHDLIAINERGVYAICYDDGSLEAGEFATEALRRGDRVERVPLEEACARHREYLSDLPAFRGVQSPSPPPLNRFSDWGGGARGG